MTLYQFLRIVEMRTKIISVSAFTIGTLYAVYLTGQVNWPILVLMLAAVLAVDMATTGFNTFFDYLHGVDRHDTNRELDKVLVHENVAPGVALIVSLVLYALAILMGGVLAIRVSPMIAVFGAISMAIGYLYTGGKHPISATPMGELVAGGFLGWGLIALSAFVQYRSVISTGFAPSAIALGIPSLLMVGSILTVNNTCDIVGDTISKRRTLSIILGERWGAWLVYGQGFLCLLSALLLTYWSVLPPVAYVTLAAATVLSLPTYRALHRNGYSHGTKMQNMGLISRIFVLFSLSMIVPLGWQAVQALR